MLRVNTCNKIVRCDNNHNLMLSVCYFVMCMPDTFVVLVNKRTI